MFVIKISYEPLWATMKEKNTTQYNLLKLGIDSHTLQSLRDNKSITLHTLGKLCKILECTPNDIVSFLEEK